VDVNSNLLIYFFLVLVHADELEFDTSKFTAPHIVIPLCGAEEQDEIKEIDDEEKEDQNEKE